MFRILLVTFKQYSAWDSMDEMIIYYQHFIPVHYCAWGCSSHPFFTANGLLPCDVYFEMYLYYLSFNCLEHLIDMKYVRSLPTSKSLYCCSLQKTPKKNKVETNVETAHFNRLLQYSIFISFILFKLWWIIYLTDIGHLNMDAQLWIFEHKYNMNTRYDTY